MSVTEWFGNLQLAWKYALGFAALLVLVIIAGLIKVLFDRRKLNKARKVEEEAGPSQDTVELNQREKDEGDLFGIRAIEAGFYAGVAQSRPTSRAGSRAGSILEHPGAMSNSTLVGGGVNSPLMKNHSTNNSVLSLNLGNDANSQRRASPPAAMKLRPSEAELTGRHGAVDMSLQVPPSPGFRNQPAQTFGGSESDSDDYAHPRSMSPRSADFNPQYYAPTAPGSTVPMPDALQVSYHSGDSHQVQSQYGSYNNSPGESPTLPAPSNPPAARLPTLPQGALRKESRSPSPEYENPQVRVYQPNNELAHIPSTSPPRAQAAAPNHKRDESDASSDYSNGNRLSHFQAYQAYQKQADRSGSAASNDTYNYNSTSPDESARASVVLPGDKNGERRPSESSSHLAPTGAKDSRLSEFYDAYYRNSQIGPAQPVEARQHINRQSTIIEVDSPMPSPLFPKTQQPGAAF